MTKKPVWKVTVLPTKQHFSEVVFKNKTVILDSYTKKDINVG